MDRRKLDEIQHALLRKLAPELIERLTNQAARLRIELFHAQGFSPEKIAAATGIRLRRVIDHVEALERVKGGPCPAGPAMPNAAPAQNGKASSVSADPNLEESPRR